MEDVSQTLKDMVKDVARWGGRFAVFSGVIALATVMVVVTQVTCTVSSASAGTSGGSVSAAKPAGELRIAMAGIGVMRPIPWQETPFSKGYLTLLYDFLVGAHTDGSMSTANGAAEKWDMSPDGTTWTFSIRQGIT